MKQWQMGLGVLVVAGLALSAIFINTDNQQAAPGTGNGASPTAPASNNGQAGTLVMAQPGYMAPDFTLNDMQGKPVKLSDFRGKRVLINFWASWCPPCKAEMPDLVKKSEQYKDQVVFLGINTLERDESGPAKFISQFNVKYQNVLDTKNVVSEQYQVLGIPTTITIAPDGKIVDRANGMMQEPQMEAMIQKLLKK